jgi:hypothetical protein
MSRKGRAGAGLRPARRWPVLGRSPGSAFAIAGGVADVDALITPRRPAGSDSMLAVTSRASGSLAQRGPATVDGHDGARYGMR